MNPDFQDFREYRQNRPPLRVFLSASVVLFFLSLSAADSIGFVPYYIDGSTPLATSGNSVALSNLPQLGEETANSEIALPERIVIPAIGLDLPVQNPSTRDIDTLDVLLQKGPVRYVDSAKLGQKGNVLIFAHSSRLPIVKNQMFRAFNRVSELSSGDTITVTGKDSSGEEKSYIYFVSSVRRALADEEVIDLSPKQGTVLTLVTCDTLTSKETRWILEAEFVGIVSS